MKIRLFLSIISIILLYSCNEQTSEQKFRKATDNESSEIYVHYINMGMFWVAEKPTALENIIEVNLYKEDLHSHYEKIGVFQSSSSVSSVGITEVEENQFIYNIVTDTGSFITGDGFPDIMESIHIFPEYGIYSKRDNSLFVLNDKYDVVLRLGKKSFYKTSSFKVKDGKLLYETISGEKRESKL